MNPNCGPCCNHSPMLKFIKDWMLVISIVSGIVVYLVYRALPVLQPLGVPALSFIRTVQPLLIFAMLFLSFSTISPRDLRLHKWQWEALIFQAVMFAGAALLLYSGILPQERIALESFALCMICPTATACAVVAAKLGGDKASVLTYTVLANLLTALLVPLFVPLLYPRADHSFVMDAALILGKVLPLLLLPCLCAWAVRYAFPRLHSKLLNVKDLPFYLWAVSLMFAILMSTRAIVRSNASIMVIMQIFSGSLLACVLQFFVGRRIGARYGQGVTAGQVLGQKNTVFAIWMGYTFLDPVTSLAGGFYSIWHNCYNTWQLRHHKDTF